MALHLDSLQNALNRQPKRIDDGRTLRTASTAAVLTPDLDLWFMRRASRDGDPWSGHISFPGGKMEASDSSPLHAAIRETEEEVGLTLSTSQVLGEFDEISTVQGLPPMRIQSFAFLVDEPMTFSLNAEVQSMHRIHLQSLLDGVGRTQFELSHLGHRRTLPAVDFDGVRLWGLTLMVVDDLLDRIDGQGKGLARPRR